MSNNITNRNSNLTSSGLTSNASYESLLSSEQPDNNLYIAFGLQDVKMQSG